MIRNDQCICHRDLQKSGISGNAKTMVGTNLISVFKSFENTLVHVCFIYSLLDAVMNEPVGLQQDDDVTVLNRPAAEALYMPRHATAQDSMDDEI